MICGLCENSGYLIVAGKPTSAGKAKIGLFGPATRKFSTVCRCEAGRERAIAQGDDQLNEYRATLAVQFIQEHANEAEKHKHPDGTAWSYTHYLDVLVFSERFGEAPKWAGGSGMAEKRNAAMVHAIGGLGGTRDEHNPERSETPEPVAVDEIEF